ncbi:GMC oxidoreductase [Histidinibacterium aquaticum]|uniref:GMC family oxidoreductase n=1 Tax=Histidinibacterium aquaticum TaxID=2613962 RepID=A0A5J5GPC4_9RHOB|nr:GMC family oxidoreductase [Histidinibacterium aquaticum]KAA9009418.1 GMC family oxidoreductase [Histidinibacterium aquaticum]
MSRLDRGPFPEGRAVNGIGDAGVRVIDLSTLGAEDKLDCDVLIVGAGPAGLTVARGLDGRKLDIVILESGDIEETRDAEELNGVEISDDTWTEAEVARRAEYHSALTEFWEASHQQYGVRCRGIGGSTAAWAGKSAAFDDIDFRTRPWVANSGWPIARADLDDALDRAAGVLNLGPNCYDDALWGKMGRDCPVPRPDEASFRSFFWQFARSRIDPMTILNAGREFLNDAPVPCRILTGATVTAITASEDGSRVEGVEVAARDGRRRRVSARTVVLAASAIENARLLLASRSPAHPAGLGNGYDVVGRHLMDHPCAVVGGFSGTDIQRMAELFGFFGLRTPTGVTMYMRGLAPTAAVQEAEGLLNCAGFMPGERAEDDPWDAAKRLLSRRSESLNDDARAILRSPGLVARGLGRLALQSRYMPRRLSRFAIDQVVRFRPDVAAEEYLTGGVPHKLTGLDIQVVSEQVPEPENRITLSHSTDRHGVPLPLARWVVGELERRTLARVGTLMTETFGRSGLPVPHLEPWVVENRLDEATIIDMAHASGTTRMSADPRLGVVDADCQVHGVCNLFVAGASVFPTSGHANPTLMITALSVRLADRLTRQMVR